MPALLGKSENAPRANTISPSLMIVFIFSVLVFVKRFCAKRQKTELFLPMHYNFTRFSRSALAITDTELNDIAAPAMMGLSNSPKNG